ncbi:Uncharacterized membrane protein [Flavobacteriaceae bacterium MAR_2010_188]|nr:Uncharacterized membrane protein [Flavobacteriaceae bacterium MAR_2010_188]
MNTQPTDIPTSDGKTIAVIAYLTIFGLIIAFVMNNDKQNHFAKYHTKQSLGLCLTGLAIGIIGFIPILGWIINLMGFITLLILWIIGLMNAVNGEKMPVPLLGKKYEEWLNNL